jgi:hypothetical protein
LGLALAALIALATGSHPAPAARPHPGHAFHARVEAIDAETRARMTGVSWHRGCPAGFADLRPLTVRHWGFDGRPHRGRLVVNRDAAVAMLGTMRRLYRLRFPIRRMRLADAYDADDRRSMAADNTSAFNCRFVAGTPYANRSRHRKGMIHCHGPVVKAFASAGWEWAGNWSWPKDPQHFSATGS